MSKEINMEEIIKEALRKLKIKIGESEREISNMIKDFIENISVEDILSNLKTAWKLEKIETEELSLEKCISIVKAEFDQKLYSTACILDKKDVDRNSKYRFEIHICFLDKNNEPMLKGNAKHWIIYTNKLDRDLSNQFGNKDMIILK